MGAAAADTSTERSSDQTQFRPSPPQQFHPSLELIGWSWRCWRRAERQSSDLVLSLRAADVGSAWLRHLSSCIAMHCCHLHHQNPPPPLLCCSPCIHSLERLGCPTSALRKCLGDRPLVAAGKLQQKPVPCLGGCSTVDVEAARGNKQPRCGSSPTQTL